MQKCNSAHKNDAVQGVYKDGDRWHDGGVVRGAWGGWR